MISDNEGSFDLSKYPEASDCLLSRYICDKLQIDYIVEIGRNIVHKILVILEKNFNDEMDSESDLSKKNKKIINSDQGEDLLIISQK